MAYLVKLKKKGWTVRWWIPGENRLAQTALGTHDENSARDILEWLHEPRDVGVSLAEAAQIAGVTRARMENWAICGKVRSFRASHRCVRILPEDIPRREMTYCSWCGVENGEMFPQEMFEQRRLPFCYDCKQRYRTIKMGGQRHTGTKDEYATLVADRFHQLWRKTMKGMPECTEDLRWYLRSNRTNRKEQNKKNKKRRFNGQSLISRDNRIYFVYVIGQASALGPVKIGIALSPEERLKVIQSASPSPLRLYGKKRCASKAEAMNQETLLHQAFVMNHCNAEWFNVTYQDVKIISDGFVDVDYVPDDIRPMALRAAGW